MTLKKIKLLLTDVDGILTNGKVIYGEHEEWVQFDIQDGIGQRLAAYGGLTVGWLTGRQSKAVEARARKLKVPYLYQGKLDKLTVAKNLCKKMNLTLSEAAYLGDDLIDLPLLAQVGWSATVPYGRPEVKKIVHFVTRAHAGDGAFREAVERILKAQGNWAKTLKVFHQENNRLAPLTITQST